MDKKVPELLKAAAATYEQRNKIYGDSYKEHGKIMSALFPELTLSGVDDFNRFGVLNMMVSKLTRYAANFNEGGHEDSIHDLVVYSAMLLELDDDSLN